MARSRKSTQEHDELLDKIKADFDARLAKLAADPAKWVTFIETVASFGAQYTLNNQFLLLMQAEERQMDPTFFLPFGNKTGTSGWKKHGRSVRKGEKAFYVWAPIKRRPKEEKASRWEAEGRMVKRDEHGRPAIQVVGFRLSATFDLSQTDGEPFEVPTVQRARRIKAAGGVLPQLLEGDDPTGAHDEIVTQLGRVFTRGGHGNLLLALSDHDRKSPRKRGKLTSRSLAHLGRTPCLPSVLAGATGPRTCMASTFSASTIASAYAVASAGSSSPTPWNLSGVARWRLRRWARCVPSIPA